MTLYAKKCPKCGSKNIEIGGNIEANTQRYEVSMECLDCGHEWADWRPPQIVKKRR